MNRKIVTTIATFSLVIGTFLNVFYGAEQPAYAYGFTCTNEPDKLACFEIEVQGWGTLSIYNQ